MSNESDIELGRWIYSAWKHLRHYDAASVGRVGATAHAGKAGDLMGRLRMLERYAVGPLQALAKDAGISLIELGTITLPTLEAVGGLQIARIQGQVAYVTPLAIDQDDVMGIVASVWESLAPEPVERAALTVLRAASSVPRTHAELIDICTSSGLDERTAEEGLEFSLAVSLVKRRHVADHGVDLYFNEFLWGDNIARTADAIARLPTNIKEGLSALLDELHKHEGRPASTVESASPELLRFAAENGIIEQTEIVTTDGRSAGFSFTPRLRGYGVSKDDLVDDLDQIRLVIASFNFAQHHALNRLNNPVAFLDKLIDAGVAGNAQPIATDYGALEKQQIVGIEPIFRGAQSSVCCDQARRPRCGAGHDGCRRANWWDTRQQRRGSSGLTNVPRHGRHTAAVGARVGRGPAPPRNAPRGRARCSSGYAAEAGANMTPSPRLSKGSRWEYRVHRALFASGWHVRRSVNLHERVLGSPQTLAEIDLFGVSFDVGLAPISLVGECKDRKGSTKEADRVVWLLGLAQIVPASHLLFAKPRLAGATVQFARPTRVALWDEAAVLEIEQRAGLGDEAFGTFDPHVGEEVFGGAGIRASLTDSRLRDGHDWLQSAFWYQTNAARLRRLHTHLGTVVTETERGSSTRLVLIAQGLLGLLVCALTTAGELRRGAPQVSRSAQMESLASGAARASALREIAARADDYYRDAIERYADSLNAPKAPFVLPRLVDYVAQPPDWAAPYLNFADTLGGRPANATDVLRFAELELFDGHLVGRDPGPGQALLIHSDHAWHRGALGLAAGFCERIWGLEDPLFAALRRPSHRGAPPVPSGKDPLRNINATAAAADTQTSLLDGNAAGSSAPPGPR